MRPPGAKHSAFAIECGTDGWYTNSATVSIDQYENYVIQELVPKVEVRFRLIRTRDDEWSIPLPGT
jgi:hypothetical protein